MKTIASIAAVLFLMLAKGSGATFLFEFQGVFRAMADPQFANQHWTMQLVYDTATPNDSLPGLFASAVQSAILTVNGDTYFNGPCQPFVELPLVIAPACAWFIIDNDEFYDRLKIQADLFRGGDPLSDRFEIQELLLADSSRSSFDDNTLPTTLDFGHFTGLVDDAGMDTNYGPAKVVFAQITQIPEPSRLLLLALGGTGLILRRSRANKSVLRTSYPLRVDSGMNVIRQLPKEMRGFR